MSVPSEKLEEMQAMAFSLILEKLAHIEASLNALTPLLSKIIAHLETHFAQVQPSEVPVATWAQLYPEVQDAAPTCEQAPQAPVDGPSLPRPRGGVWRWFVREDAP